MAALNSQKKGPKNTRCNVSNRLKFGKITRKDLLCTRMLKNRYRKFDVGAL